MRTVPGTDRLLALPARHGGLGVTIPTRNTNKQIKACTEVTAPLVELIRQRNPSYPELSQLEQRQKKFALRTRNRRETTNLKKAELLKPKLSGAGQRAMEQASEKGASSWLTAIPMSKHGFNLHKQAFRDALCLRFGWTPTRLATHCPCGQPFSVNHVFSCPKGAMLSIRHNAIRDITAQLLMEVCPNMCVEPTLQRLTGESFPLRSTNTEEGARLDVKAQNFWDKSKQSTFFDVRIFNSHAPSNCTTSTDACYRRHEQRILEVEHGTFTPLVLSKSGGWGPSATVAFKRLAGLISEKHDQPYSSTLNFIRCKIAFSLIDSAVACLRDPRSAFHAPARDFNLTDHPLDLIRAEVQLQA